MKKVTWTYQLGLAWVLLILGGIAYWVEFKHRPEKEAKEEQSKKVFAIKDAPVRTIRVADGAKNFEFLCSDFEAKLCKTSDNSKWEVTQPGKFKADDGNVNSFLTSIISLTSSEVVDLKSETPEKRQAMLKDYGLDAAGRKNLPRVFVTTAAGETTLYLGQTHPLGDSVFGLVAQNQTDDETKVYLVPNYFKTGLDHDLTYWRNKKLVTLGTHEIEEFDLKGSQAQIQSKRKDGQWVLKSPKGEEMPGDVENIDNFLTSITYMMAKSFVADSKTDPKAKKALQGKKIAEVILHKTGVPASTSPAPGGKDAAAAAAPTAPKDAPVTIVLYEGPKTVYATVSNLDPVFEMDSSVRSRIDKPLKEFRLTKLITSSERFAAKKIEFTGPSIGTLTLENKEGKWLDLPAKAEIAVEKLQDTLDKLSGSRIKEFIASGHGDAAEKSGLQLTLSDEKNTVKRQLAFWKKGKQLYAKDLMSKRGEVFLLDDTMGEALPWAKDFYLKKSVEKNEPQTAAKSDKT